MTRRTEDSEEPVDRSLGQDFLKDGWARTVADMRAMAEDREGKGFETMTLAADDTTPIAPSMGDDDRFGFSHLVPGDEGEQFREFVEGRDFTETAVYQSTDSGHVFMVTEVIDYEDEAIAFVAGTFRMGEAAALVRAATDRGKLHTYVRKLDQTIMGTFEHDDVGAFFPDPDRYSSYEPDNPF